MTGVQTALKSPAAPRASAIADSSGATLCVDAGRVLNSPSAVRRFREQVYDILGNDFALAIRIGGLSIEGNALAEFEAICRILTQAAGAAHADRSGIELVIAAGTVAPKVAWSTRIEHLGIGPLYLVADGHLMRPGDPGPTLCNIDLFWQECWELRLTRMVRLACAPIVSSSCWLLPAEHADAVYPGAGLQVPAASAWVSFRLSLPDYANSSGEIDKIALAAALASYVDAGETYHDVIAWPTAHLRHDAWLHRRLAIQIGGIGDLVRRRGENPCRFTCLQKLSELLTWCRTMLQQRSREIALQAGGLPALQDSEILRGTRCGRAMEDWFAQWQRAVETSALRHRTLLAMSPWAVFPNTAVVESGYCDLLPLLALADACAFGRPRRLEAWNVNEFKRLHQLTWAIQKQKTERQVFAEPG